MARKLSALGKRAHKAIRRKQESKQILTNLVKIGKKPSVYIRKDEATLTDMLNKAVKNLYKTDKHAYKSFLLKIQKLIDIDSNLVTIPKKGPIKFNTSSKAPFKNFTNATKTQNNTYRLNELKQIAKRAEVILNRDILNAHRETLRKNLQNELDAQGIEYKLTKKDMENIERQIEELGDEFDYYDFSQNLIDSMLDMTDMTNFSNSNFAKAIAMMYASDDRSKMIVENATMLNQINNMHHFKNAEDVEIVLGQTPMTMSDQFKELERQTIEEFKRKNNLK